MASKGLTAERAAELDAMLREMFEAVAARPIPSRLLSVVDQFYHEEAPRSVAAPRRRRT